MRCAIWYHLYNLKNVKNTHGGVLKACNFTKSNTPPWVFFTFFGLYSWYQIPQNITNINRIQYFVIHSCVQFHSTWRIFNFGTNVNQKYTKGSIEINTFTVQLFFSRIASDIAGFRSFLAFTKTRNDVVLTCALKHTLK